MPYEPKVGDRVRIGEHKYDNSGCTGMVGLVGQCGVITEIDNGKQFMVQLDGKPYSDGCFSLSQILPLETSQSKKFKVGDKVVVKYITTIASKKLNGSTATISEVHIEDFGLSAERGGGYCLLSEITGGVFFDELTKISESLTPPGKKGKSMLQRLSSLPQAIRRAFDADQKALYRAGYIDENGKWTTKAVEEADDEMIKDYLDKNRKEFVDRSNEAIELAKEEKEE